MACWDVALEFYAWYYSLEVEKYDADWGLFAAFDSKPKMFGGFCILASNLTLNMSGLEVG